MRSRLPLAFLIPLVALAWSTAVLVPTAATAGCGCDHPPPGWARIMPAFGSPGKDVRLNAPTGKEFLPGAPYLVKIGGGNSIVVATDASHLMATVSTNAQPGPSEVEIEGPAWTHKYAKSDFTVLSPAPLVPEQTAVFRVSDYQASISEDGTLLVPFNLTQIAEATQFLVLVGGLPVSFEQDDVVFYNSDGVDLTLFTLQVEDPTERQWGSYFGWDVEQDTGITGTVYGSKVMSWLGSSFSDQLTYWRHEFHTYKAAHAAGSSHEVDASGYHFNDGTLHIDHDHLVLAISGKLRDSVVPREQWDDLSPGSESVDVYVATVQSENPLEPYEIMGALFNSMGSGSFQALASESTEAYDHDEDDEDDDEADDD